MIITRSSMTCMLLRRVAPPAAAFGLLTACAAPYVAAPLPVKSVERPVFVSGDTWVFAKRVPPIRTTNTFVEERATLLVFRQAIGGGRPVPVLYTPTRALFQGGVDDISMWGPLTFPWEGALAFPLAVGKKWNYTWPGTMPDQYRRDTIVNWLLAAKVAAWEAVPTAGGAATFNAFRVEIEQHQPKPYDVDAKVYYWTIWYAPAAKCVVKWRMQASKAMYAESAELVEFRSGP
jgi:hypothetical protein